MGFNSAFKGLTTTLKSPAVCHCEICHRKSGNGAGFLWVLQLLPVSVIPPVAHTHLILTLLSSEGQVGKAGGPSNQAMLSSSLDRKYCHTVSVPALKNSWTYLFQDSEQQFTCLNCDGFSGARCLARSFTDNMATCWLVSRSGLTVSLPILPITDNKGVSSE